MPTSKFQSATKDRLAVLLHGYSVQENVRPDWLVNPKTGRRLELDFWLPEVKVAIEVQGVQHSKFVPMFHKTEECFRDQVERDDFKRVACAEHGVFLYEVNRVEDIDGFIEAAEKFCPEMAFELFKKWSSIKVLAYYAARLYEASAQNRHHLCPRSRVRGFANKIERICRKYNIAPETITPDFTIRKIEMSFIGSPIIKMFEDQGHYVRSKAVALRSCLGGKVTCIANGVDGGQKVFEFDQDTGKQQGDGTWSIRVDDPDVLEGLASLNEVSE